MIFINAEKKVLLYRRDDIPSIAEPNKWDLFGGHVEVGEQPDEAIAREIGEELDVYSKDGGCIQPKEYRRFRKYQFEDREEHVYWSKLNYPTSELMIKEGQEPLWFSQSEVENLDIAFRFKDVLREFFRSLPQARV